MVWISGCVAGLVRTGGRAQNRWDASLLGDEFEQLADEADLTSDIIALHPPNLSLPDHIHRFVPLNRPSRGMKFAKALFGIDSALDRSMVLFQDVVQVLHRPMPTSPPERSFLLYVWDRRAVDRRQVGVDDPWLGMGAITQRFAEQPFGRIRVAQRRQQEIDGGTGRINRSIQVAPAPLDSNVGFVDPPGFVGGLEMPSHPLLDFGTIALYPTPDRRMIGSQTALVKQLLDIPERERVAKIPADRTKDEFRLGLAAI